jgi:uncharacterized protein (TIGR01777 family)
VTKPLPRVILTGAHGLIGQAVGGTLIQDGFCVFPLRSRQQGPMSMDTASGWIDKNFLENAHAVVHLAGEPIAQRWTDASKNRILLSRTESTALLANTLAQLKNPPKVFISISGINRYGFNRPNEILTEESEVKPDGFLGEVTEAWEAATHPAQPAGIRTVYLRTGLVLAASGGALKTMLPAFVAGLGGRIGPGTQHLSWIRLGDLAALISWIIKNETIHGAVNGVAPHPLTQMAFAEELGKILKRPTSIPMPAWLVSTLFGQMGSETLLADLNVVPAIALKSGFKFTTPEINSALTKALKE